MSHVLTAPPAAQAVRQSVGLEADTGRVLVVILTARAHVPGPPHLPAPLNPRLSASMTAPFTDVPLDEVGLFPLRGQHHVNMLRE